MNKQTFKLILKNLDKFYEILQPILDKECKSYGFDSIDLTDEHCLIDADENHIRIEWEETIHHCGCCSPDYETRTICIDDEEIEEILNSLSEKEGE